MVVHPVLEAGRAGSVRAVRAFQYNGAIIRKDEAGSYEEEAALPGRNTAVVFSQKPCALRDQQVATGGLS